MSAAQPQRERPWRSLEPLAHASPDEFPPGSSEWDHTFGRRDFLRTAAASLALASAAACTRQPREEIVPYVRQPEDAVPGKAQWFATAMTLGGTAHGLLVRSHEGRPTKIEGNPGHPGSLGRSTIHAQAALLDLYDPARSQTLRQSGSPATWEDFLGLLLAQTPRWKTTGGAGLRLLTGSIASPTLRAQIAALLQKFPAAQWHAHDSAFPLLPTRTRCHFDRAEVILSLDADFLGSPLTPPRDILAFAKKRAPENGLNRLYVLESMPSLTGAMADHRRALRPSDLEKLALALAGGTAPDEWSAALFRDLQQHRGRSLILAGDCQPPSVHAAARELNDALGNTGLTLESFAREPSPPAGHLTALVADMRHGNVHTLLMLDGNPVFTAPADLAFPAALSRVPLTIHHGLHLDETARLSTWHIPASHFLEAWSDARDFDGHDSIVQPLIDPLYPTKSAHELLAALTAPPLDEGYQIIRTAWREKLGAENFDLHWRKALHDGVTNQVTNKPPPSVPSPSASLEKVTSLDLVIRPDPHLLDGRFATNVWLQELPKPLTKLTWENAAHLSPRTAAELLVKHGDVIDLSYRGRKVTAPAWILPGHADHCITIHLGHGRAHGFNAAALQTSDALWGGSGLAIAKTGRRHTFSTTQEHQQMEGRDLVRVQNASEPLPPHKTEPQQDESLYPSVKYERPSWGMVIDLNACIGCSACTIACQAENNIPAVGREQVLRGREMHWIRVDRYFEGSPENPRILHQPVPCMHCENAPCELVCPVAATVHDHAGLNLMVYNRCIGTRYCSNNCPYKVRRFNFLQYVDNHSPQLKLQRNPDVTVRMRGVMEKCTYCVQRISAAHIAAGKESRPIRDGEVTPACAQACPAGAITFGDILDPGSRVTTQRQSQRHYSLLAELNARPRTTYLAKVRNPNPEISA